VNNSGDLDDGAAVTNAGTLTVNADDTVDTYEQNGAGLLNGTNTLTATNGATLNGGEIAGSLSGVTEITDDVLVSGTGTIGGGGLTVSGGTLTLDGSSTNNTVDIEAGATLVNNSGDLDDGAAVTNAGTLTVNADDTVDTYEQNGAGLLNGTNTLTATNGATLNGGVLAGSLLGDVVSTGPVTISGTIGGGTLSVTGGVLQLTGIANSGTTINGGATLLGSGTINGSVLNNGTIGVIGGNQQLSITGDFTNNGLTTLTLNNDTTFQSILVGGTANLGGALTVTNLGAGLDSGQVALLIDAGAYNGAFTTFTAAGFTNGVLFNNLTGQLIGLAGGQAKATKTYLNLNLNQTEAYLSLYEDVIDLGLQNVTTVYDPIANTYTINLAPGTADGDPLLNIALLDATVPGEVLTTVINQLTPESHSGMVDYTEHALRNHARTAVDAAPVSRVGDTQVFATAHSTWAGADSSTTNSDYDIEMYGVTVGVRHDVDDRFQIGGFLGFDDGSIKGTMIDTDAQGWAIGAFGSYLIDEGTQTKMTATASYGAYSFDAARNSYGGRVSANDIDSDAFEFALGVITTSFEQDGFRVMPNAGLRYLTGSVDGFTETGTGVPLNVRKQDVESLLLEVGVDFEYALQEQWTFAGHLGYMNDLSSSGNSVTSTFAASGTDARPFTVNAPGVGNEAFVLGAGAYYDINDAARVGLVYRGEYRSDSQSTHSVGIGASFGF